MKNTALVVDSSFGIHNGEYPNTYVLPLIINEMRDKKINAYHDGVDITPSQLIKKLEQGSNIKTSQSIPGEILELLTRLSKQYKKIFVFPIPLSISSGCNTWKVIAGEFDNVIVFEQGMVSLPAKWTIIDLLELMNQKKTLTEQDVYSYLKNIYTKRIGLVIVPDSRFLVRGGRVSNFKRMIIKLLNLKLVITLYNDGFKFYDKVSSMSDMVEVIARCFSDKSKRSFDIKKLKRFSLFYSKSNNPKYKTQTIVSEIKKTYPTINVTKDELPAIIAAHTGPDYIVVLCEYN